ncbi:glycosyltransferase [Microbacterium sp. E-13]|uniref:glycosyltransferase n=1 Tax=Microbacterium sp. E-13 TaxID=3404048 RepID=UPI003CF0AF36
MTEARYYGHTRFSVHLPGNGAWKISRQGAEYTDALFRPERMALRSDVFLNLAMPVYQSWAERFDYRHIVHFSRDLPEEWRSRLEIAAARHPCVILDEVTREIAVDSVIASDLGSRGRGSDIAVRIRVDDDDILAADYLDRLAAYVSPEHVGFAVSFGLGVAALYDDGAHTDFRLKREVLPSAGQAYIGRFDPSSMSVRELADAPHNRIDTVAPVIFDSREPMYLQTYHGTQDKEWDRDDDHPSSRLQARSELIDAALLEVKFPTVRLRGGTSA